MVDKLDESLNFFQDEDFYIYGGFDDTIVKHIIPYLIYEIDKKSKLKDAKIKFHILSHGGKTAVLDNLLALFEMAKKKGIIIETYALSIVFSSGSLLACAGTKKHRFISEDTQHLCHLGYVPGWSVSNDIEAEREAKRAKHHFDKVRRHYKKYANIKNLDELIRDDDLSFYGQEVIDNGLADKFI